MLIFSNWKEKESKVPEELMSKKHVGFFGSSPGSSIHHFRQARSPGVRIKNHQLFVSGAGGWWWKIGTPTNNKYSQIHLVTIVYQSIICFKHLCWQCISWFDLQHFREVFRSQRCLGLQFATGHLGAASGVGGWEPEIGEISFLLARKSSFSAWKHLKVKCWKKNKQHQSTYFSLPNLMNWLTLSIHSSPWSLGLVDRPVSWLSFGESVDQRLIAELLGSSKHLCRVAKQDPRQENSEGMSVFDASFHLGNL